MNTVMSEDPCETCLLRKNIVPNKGGSNPRFLVVCKPPSASQVRDGNNLIPSARKLFGKYMGNAGFTSADFVFTNAIKCGYDPTRFQAKDRHTIEGACRTHLLRLIERMKPEVIIPMGADAAKAVYGRAVKITKIRGVPEYSQILETLVLPIMDPSYVHIYPQHRDIFSSDCETLKRVVHHSYDLEAVEKEVLGNYHKVYDLQFLIDNPPELLSFDTETLGKRWQEAECRIMTMQISTEPGNGYLIPWDHPDEPASMRFKQKIRNQLKVILQNPRTSVIGQNGKYDRLWVESRLGFEYRVDHDTIMLAACLDENMQSKDLSTLTKMYVKEMAGYDDAFNSKYDKSRMDLVPLNDIIPYAVGDTDACLRVFYELLPKVQADQRLWRYYRRVAMPMINAFAPIELRGMLIDEVALEELEKQVSTHLDALKKKLLKQVPSSIKRAHVEKGISFTRREFLRDILFDHSDGLMLEPKVYTASTVNLKPEFRVPSTSTKDHLPYFFEDYPFVVDLSEYLKLERLLSTSIRSFRDKYITDGRIYPSYGLHTAVTGRTNSRDPNSQNFVKRGLFASAYRNIFVCPPGYVMIEADLSQAELRIAAVLANDTEMLRVFQEGGDIHTATACVVMGVSPEAFNALLKKEQKLARFKAKAVNFGFIYGMGFKKFIVYAKTQYGVEFTEKEAKDIRIRFFKKYRSLQPWHDAVREFVANRGFVRSYSGRIRHLPMIWSEDEKVSGEASRQAINSPVQCFASDLGIMAVSRIEREIRPEYLSIVGFVHDALYAIVPEHYLEWGAKKLKWYMETNPLKEWFDLDLKVPITADVGFGWRGGTTYEMGKLEYDKLYDFAALEDEYEVDFELIGQSIPPEDGRRSIREHMEIYV